MAGDLLSRLPASFESVLVLGIVSEDEFSRPDKPHGYAVASKDIREHCGTEGRVVEVLGSGLLTAAQTWRSVGNRSLTKETARLAAKWARELAAEFDKLQRGLPSES